MNIPPLPHLKARAKILTAIRDFFATHGVLEVQTPILSRFGGTDACISPVMAQGFDGQKLGYLHTSPEFMMKKILAKHPVCIYQICSVFRGFEHGARHHHEFSMLEFYRLGMTLDDLMHHTHALFNAMAIAVGKSFDGFDVKSYRAVFETHLGMNPHQVCDDDLADVCLCHHGNLAHDLTRDGRLDLLFSHHIEPHLGKDKLTFLNDFPASMAALAKTHEVNGDVVAARFEVYYHGIELANAFDELADSTTLRARFDDDNAYRQNHGLPIIAMDTDFLAIANDLPDCVGIAVGLDRLIMLLCDGKNLADVCVLD